MWVLKVKYLFTILSTNQYGRHTVLHSDLNLPTVNSLYKIQSNQEICLEEYCFLYILIFYSSILLIIHVKYIIISNYKKNHINKLNSDKEDF